MARSEEFPPEVVMATQYLIIDDHTTHWRDGNPALAPGIIGFDLISLHLERECQRLPETKIRSDNDDYPR